MKKFWRSSTEKQENFPSVSDKVNNIYKQFGVDATKDSLMNMDSLKRITMIVKIEEEFNISIPSEFMKPDIFSNSKILIEMIENLIGE